MNNANGGNILFHFKGDTKDLSSSMGGLTKKFALGTLAAQGVSKALQVMTRNIGDAVSRVDTLNNFPRVMKNLGISTKDSQKAINKLSKDLQGLPTSLNDAAGAVQRFTSANNDVKKSTDIFLAVNNALIAGGASAETQATAMEQLSQAYAKGKPDAMEWRSMLTAMPAQLKQVANSLGYTSTAVGGDFYEAIQSGKLSMDDFMNAFIKLNKEGTGNFASFAEQAKGSTAGIQTSITNMKTAFVRGVADIINKVNEALKPFGGLSGVINKVGQLGEKAFKKIGDILSVAIPKIIDFAKWLDKYKDIIMVLSAPLLAIIAAMKIYNTVMTIATAVQAAYNAVMMANPIVLIIMAIIGVIALLVAGFIYLWNHCEGFRNFWIGLWNGIKTVVMTAWNFIKGIFTGVINFIKNNWQALLLMLVNPFAGAFKLIYDNCEPFRNFINGFVNGIKNFFNGLKTGIGNAVNGIVNFIKSIPGKIASIPGKIVNAFKKIPGQVLNIGKNIMKGLWNGISGLKDWVINKVKSMGKSIVKGLKKVLGIHSPSKVMAKEIGQWIPKGVAVGIDANTDSVYKAVKDMNNMVMTGIDPNLTSSMSNHFSPTVNTNVTVNQTQDPLGRMVNDIKTFSGGSRQDYNYGLGV